MIDVPTVPPIAWFRDPGLDELTPLTVTDDGRVYGHLCAWHQAHTSFPGRNITPPRSMSDYRWFHTGATTVEDGAEQVQISVGALTMNTNHASTSLNADAAAAHYDHTGSVVAVVCAGEDQHGVWYSGALLPDVDEVTRRRFRACGLSGDWRAIESGRLDLVAALAVPHGGFPIPRARVASGARLALVAAGAVAPGLAAFTRRIPDGWAAKKTPDRFGLASFSPAHLADMVADRLDRRRRDAELAAAQSALVGDLDDTAALTASLLESVDDTAAREAALLAELDDTGSALEALAQDNDGSFLSRMPPQLRESYLTGKAAAKIQWGTPGDFARCEAEAAHHGIPEHERAGMCSDLHQEALGVRPGQEKG